MVKYLTNEEEIRLLDSVEGRHKQRDKIILVMLLNTGLRIGELTNLQIKDVVNGNRETKKELQLRKETIKNHNSRIIPLNEKARQAIKDLLTWNKEHNYRQLPGDLLLLSQKGKKFTKEQVQRIIRKARERANLDFEATPHSLRHTFATRVYAKTNNLRVVQKLLGHKSVSTTQIYADVNKEQLRDAVNQL